MSVFRNERVRRILRPLATILGLSAAIAHALHASSMWRQMEQYKTNDPPLSDFFWGKFQTELAFTLVAFFAGVFAWHLFKPRAPSAPTT